MKNRGMIITLIVLLAIVILLLIAVLVWALTGKNNLFGNLGRKSSQIVFEESYQLAEVNVLEIESDAGDVTFEENTENMIKIVVYGEDTSDVKVAFANGNLKIDNTEHQKNSWFSWDFYSKDIIVYIPSSYAGEINIDNDYGSLAMIDLESANVTLKTDCGDIDIGKVKNANVKCDYGDVKINTILNQCQIEASCGDIQIENVQIQENSMIKCDYGDIKIRQINDIYVDAKVDLGDVKIKNNDRQSEVILKIDADCGDIKVGES